MKPEVKEFYHPPTNTFSYVLWDPDSSSAAIVDPVMDYDHKSGRTATDSIDAITGFVRAKQLNVQWILETHAHADHLTAAALLKDALGGKIAIGEGIRQVQATFKTVFNLKDLSADGAQFDHLFKDDETFKIGNCEGRVIATPGHTNDSVTYLVDDAAFVGDTLFAPDYGTARCDFPGGNARTLYQSIRRLLALPGDIRLYLCHDYPPDGREPQFVHSVSEQAERNIHIHEGIDEEGFVQMRESRDAGLPMPNLIIPSIQVNIRAGRWPSAEDNDVVYLKVPINLLGQP